MKKIFALFLIAACLCTFASVITAKEGGKEKGEALFKQYCAACHPDGGNIVNPQMTLHLKDREAHHITTPAAIIDKMRNPGPGMIRFDEKTIPDKDAGEIAEYILKNIK
jgi:cytochrome c6